MSPTRRDRWSAEDRGRGMPRAGQRMPDIQVRADGQATTLNTVLRSGRHVLVVPAADAASVLSDSGLAAVPGSL